MHAFRVSSTVRRIFVKYDPVQTCLKSHARTAGKRYANQFGQTILYITWSTDVTNGFRYVQVEVASLLSPPFS
jgi:hypothetical protein